MKTKIKKGLWWFTGLIAAAMAFFFLVLPDLVDRHYNRVQYDHSIQVSNEVKALHRSLFITDMHADTLLWPREIQKSYHYGHIDLDRLLKGNVALEFFSVVTKTPRNLNLNRNDDMSDNITLLALAQRWPFKTFFSLTERALYQADKLNKIATKDKRLKVIKWRSELQDFILKRKENPNQVAGLLSLEGAHALEGKMLNYGKLYAAGFRMIGLSHFFDNEMGGSAHGMHKNGLTPAGRLLIARMQKDHVLIDLAHASIQLIDEVLANTTAPVVVSHTGIWKVCAGSRNLKDSHLHQIAERGGLIGIGYWPTAICGNDVADIVRSIDYVVKTVGIQAVALGSDFDGSVSTPIDSSQLDQITQALVDKGYTAEQISLIMGGNVVRLLLNYLPELQANT